MKLPKEFKFKIKNGDLVYIAKEMSPSTYRITWDLNGEWHKDYYEKTIQRNFDQKYWFIIYDKWDKLKERMIGTK